MIGKKIILTGGTGGLGESIVKELIGRGAHVIVIGRNQQRLKSLSETYQNISVFQLDLGVKVQVRKFINDVQRDGQTFDGIINNAGYGYFKSFEHHTDEDITDMFNVNVVHTLLLIKGLVPLLRPGASIVNIASQAARVTTPYGSVYAATKAALLSFSNALRLEHPELHIMTVSPGPIATNFFSRADKTGLYESTTKSIQLDKDALARDIVEAMIDKKLEVNRPGWMHQSLTVYHLAPRTIEKILRRFFLSKKF
ncbi:SDR family NAD(P)-dependent oxidoreductase [Macrococcus brunensis]|uniref:SDR family NAD(P)-dependent oxidoreductase n=1 Tax=Macrococcus brunensis TaxID=198483 RepID=UPI001EF12015|nr:SDR family NAD(P)-dependent oxidoreductase [Macrococcus brunensis]ULG71056.1 SDR family NAD(P)-dependent oxidoreductase [Macrococcus brunensis]